MKKLTILSFVAALMAAFSFTSCNTGGDSYSAPTLDQQKSMINMLGYSQSGGIGYYNENKLDTKDVIDIIPDIVAKITSETNKDKDGNIQNLYALVSFDFPVSILSKFIDDEKLAAKIAEMGKVNMKVNLIPYMYSSQTFVANCYDLQLGDIVTSEKEYKKVTVKFYNNYCRGGYEKNKDNKQYFCFFMQAAYIYVDGTQTNLLKANRFNGTPYPPLFWFTTDKQN